MKISDSDLSRSTPPFAKAAELKVAFDREDRHSHANSHTFYLRYVGPLPTGGGVKVDVTIGEQLVFPLEARPVLQAYDEFSDLSDGRVVQAYALRSRANSPSASKRRPESRRQSSKRKRG